MSEPSASKPPTPIPGAPRTGATRRDATPPPSESGPTPASRWERIKAAYDLVSDVLTPQTLFILLAAGVIGLTGLLGGWNNIATVDKALPAVSPSATATASPFALAVEKGVWLTGQNSIGLVARPGSRYVMVSIRVTNVTDQPVRVSALTDALVPHLAGLPPLKTEGTFEAPTVLKVVDGRPLAMLQPGLPYHLVVAWRQSDAEPAPTELQVDLNAQTFRLSSIDGSEDWRDPTAQHSVTIPIKPAPTTEGKK